MVSTANAQLRVVLEDDVSGPAESVAEKMEKMRSTIERGRKELSSLQRAMREMKKAGLENSEVYQTQQKRVDELQKLIGEAAGKYTNLGGTFQKTKPPTKKMHGLEKALQNLGLRTGATGGRLKSLGALMKSSGGRAMLLRGAMLAAAVAAVALFAALTKYALATANAAREERLRFEVLGHLRGRSKQAIADSYEMQNAINGVAAATGGARKEIAGYAEAAYRAGLRGKALEHAVRGATIKGAALGERYGRSFVFMSASAARAGQDVSKLADDAERRFGGLAQRRLMSFGNLFRRYKEGVASWFMGVDIEPLLQSLSRFVSLFSTSHEYGRLASRFYGWFFSWFAKGLSWLVDGVVWFTETALLWVYKGMNAFRRLGLLVMDVAITIKESIQGVFSFFDNFEFPSWFEMAKNIGSGVVRGLGSAGSAVAKAGGKLADAAARGFRKAAQIRSPSKLFAGYGDDVSTGFAMGVEDGAPRAHSAVEHLIDVPKFPSLPEHNLGGAGAARGVNVSISIGDIITQATDGAEVLETIRLRVGEVLSDLVVQEGLA